MILEETNDDRALRDNIPHMAGFALMYLKMLRDIPVYGIEDVTADDMHLSMSEPHCRFQYNT
ncbi:MAG TPA: hypothetical protein VIK55_01820 [Paludibacter sp.]